jgi:pimeloyl-ACP methyl ester carboxylesterase
MSSPSSSISSYQGSPVLPYEHVSLTDRSDSFDSRRVQKAIFRSGIPTQRVLLAVTIGAILLLSAVIFRNDTKPKSVSESYYDGSIPTEAPTRPPPEKLTGQLFPYAGGRVAFESPLRSSVPSTKKCIIIGGMTEGLFPTPYTPELEAACSQHGFSLVQPILSSSYLGFGNGRLSRDSHELDELLQYLVDERNAETFALVGHSTGCQIITYYLKHGKGHLVDRVRVAVLQAPVSDREDDMQRSDYHYYLSLAIERKEAGEADEMMPRDAFGVPITVQRYLDLDKKGGADDFFSSDYTDEELAERVSHIGRLSNLKCLVTFSGRDEYVPDTVDNKVLLSRLVNAMNADCDDDHPVAEPLYLKYSGHTLWQDDEISEFLAKVSELLAQAS